MPPMPTAKLLMVGMGGILLDLLIVSQVEVGTLELHIVPRICTNSMARKKATNH